MPVTEQSERAERSDTFVYQGLVPDENPLPLEQNANGIAEEPHSTEASATQTPDGTETEQVSTAPEVTAPTAVPVDTLPPPQQRSSSSGNAKKVKIGELLIQEGVVTPEQIEQALAAQKTRHPAPPLGEICIELGFFSPATLNKILSKHHERIPLGEMLVHLGLVTQEQITAALEIQKTSKKKLGTILVEQGHLTTNALVGVLYKQSQIAKQHQEKRQSLASMSRVSPQEMSAALAAAREQQ
ncbi:MAG: hypothetical protein FJ147_11205 [Deltaproteobacteria bacterium]|nr:hypothetical protein [Deltaproteobacteria bacterium]